MMKFLEHKYGTQIKVLQDVGLNSLLARLCHPDTHQPTINELVEFIYTQLIMTVLDQEFPTKVTRVPTRMTQKHPQSLLEVNALNTEQKVVSVNLARAGTFPSHVCYNLLNYILDPKLIRQDHVTAARVTDKAHKVIGTTLAGSKIGGPIDDSIVLFPDPMGATGGTIISALDHYKKEVKGSAKKFVSLHLIITPEYISQVTKSHPDLIVYAVRIDRGLSPEKVLKAVPGEFWQQEKGLDDNDYIVPGGGGFGEILNNSYV
ncbi:MAG: uracil phosphoribosyltransferase [Oligoflexia bacterium]|nr:uracil phosphoribosyltransferase [Oligoflexia bacterium]